MRVVGGFLFGALDHNGRAVSFKLRRLLWCREDTGPCAKSESGLQPYVRFAFGEQSDVQEVVATGTLADFEAALRAAEKGSGAS